MVSQNQRGGVTSPKFGSVSKRAEHPQEEQGQGLTHPEEQSAGRELRGRNQPGRCKGFHSFIEGSLTGAGAAGTLRTRGKMRAGGEARFAGKGRERQRNRRRRLFSLRLRQRSPAGKSISPQDNPPFPPLGKGEFFTPTPARHRGKGKETAEGGCSPLRLRQGSPAGMPVGHSPLTPSPPGEGEF